MNTSVFNAKAVALGLDEQDLHEAIMNEYHLTEYLNFIQEELEKLSLKPYGREHSDIEMLIDDVQRSIVVAEEITRQFGRQRLSTGESFGNLEEERDTRLKSQRSLFTKLSNIRKK